jgi:hypothetical protein
MLGAPIARARNACKQQRGCHAWMSISSFNMHHAAFPKEQALAFSLGREKVSRSEMSARLRNACRFRFVGWVLDSFARDSLHLR